MGGTEVNEATWEITEKPSGMWLVQEEGPFRGDDEVLICGGLTNEEASAIAAASGRVLDYECDWWQVWGIPK